MKKTLSADDQKNIRKYCRAASTREGYRVVLAREGIEALEMFISEVPEKPRQKGFQDAGI